MALSISQFRANVPKHYSTRPEENFYEAFLTNFIKSKLGLGVNCLWVVELVIPGGFGSIGSDKIKEVFTEQFKDFFNGGVASTNYNAMLVEAMKLFSDNTAAVMGTNPFWLASAININGESLNSTRPQTPESFNGIVPYIGAKRSDLSELTINTFMTDQSFSDVVVRPWVAAISRYGLKLDLLRSYIKCKFFTRKRRTPGSISTPVDWMCKLTYTFNGVFPKTIPSIEYNYNGADTTKMVNLNFGFDNYRMDIESSPIAYDFNEVFDKNKSTLSADSPSGKSFGQRLGEGIASNLDTTYIMLTPLLAIRNTDKDDVPTYSNDAGIINVSRGDASPSTVEYKNVSIEKNDSVGSPYNFGDRVKIDEEDVPRTNSINWSIKKIDEEDTPVGTIHQKVEIPERDTPEDYRMQKVEIPESDTPVGVNVKIDEIETPMNDFPTLSRQGQNTINVTRDDFPVSYGVVVQDIRVPRSDVRDSTVVSFGNVVTSKDDVPTSQTVRLETISVDDHYKGSIASAKIISAKTNDYIQ